jgi:hypothetical protein
MATGPASSANNESAAVSSTSWAWAWVMVRKGIHEPVLDLGRVGDLDNLPAFGEQDYFGHFANELQASDPLSWWPVRVQAMFC